MRGFDGRDCSVQQREVIWGCRTLDSVLNGHWEHTGDPQCVVGTCTVRLLPTIHFVVIVFHWTCVSVPRSVSLTPPSLALLPPWTVLVGGSKEVDERVVVDGSGTSGVVSGSVWVNREVPVDLSSEIGTNDLDVN